MFELTAEQHNKVYQWSKTLPVNLRTYSGAIGGRFTYSFTPTSLGNIVRVVDEITREVLDVTEYDLF